MVDPQNYKSENAWFFKQSGLKAVIRKLPAVEADINGKGKHVAPPALDIPPSSSTVDVRVIDP